MYLRGNYLSRGNSKCKHSEAEVHSRKFGDSLAGVEKMNSKCGKSDHTGNEGHSMQGLVAQYTGFVFFVTQ